MKRLWRFGGLLTLGIALLIRLAFSNRSLFETVYFQGVYPAVKSVQVWLSPLWIVPGYALLIVGLVLWLIFRFPRRWKRRDVVRFLRRAANLAASIAAVFLLSWGYLYTGSTLVERMQLGTSDAQVEPSELYLEVMGMAERQRSEIAGAVDSLTVIGFDPPTDEQLVCAVARVLTPLGYPNLKSVRVRRIKPDGTLRRLGIAGIYNPFTGEANVDDLYGAVSATFTTAHELAHAFGVTGEGDANFVAFLALRGMDDPMGRYAAYYTLWRHTAKTVNDSYGEEDLAAIASVIPEGLRIDRQATAARVRGHAPYFPEVSEAVNDSYLKIQGVEAGVADYDRFVSLYLLMRERLDERK